MWRAGPFCGDSSGNVYLNHPFTLVNNKQGNNTHTHLFFFTPILRFALGEKLGVERGDCSAQMLSRSRKGKDYSQGFQIQMLEALLSVSWCIIVMKISFSDAGSLPLKPYCNILLHGVSYAMKL